MSRLFARKAGESRPGEPADPTADTAVLPASESPRASAGEPPVGEPAAQRPAASEPLSEQPPASDPPAEPPAASDGVTEPPAASDPPGEQPPSDTAAETAAEHDPGATHVVPPTNGTTGNGRTAEPALAPPVEDDVPDRPGFRDRARVRRRARYLRKVHEVQLRDLGGLVFDLTRFGRDRPDLVRGKLDGLEQTHAELQALETVLGRPAHVTELREPGLGGTCPNCGELHGSADRFCAHCGQGLA
jgi:hypothetical protein